MEEEINKKAYHHLIKATGLPLFALVFVWIISVVGVETANHEQAATFHSPDSSLETSLHSESEIGPRPTDYRTLLPKDVRLIEKEFIDFEGDGVREIVVLGKNYADIKHAGDGEDYPGDEIFIFSQSNKTKQSEQVFHSKMDTDSHPAIRKKIISGSSFHKIFLSQNKEAIVLLIKTPSAAGQCKDNVVVIYKHSNLFTSDTLGEVFPLCLYSFRQKLPGSLELIFEVFQITEDGGLKDAGCCPSGGTEFHNYTFREGRFQKIHVEHFKESVIDLHKSGYLPDL